MATSAFSPKSDLSGAKRHEIASLVSIPPALSDGTSKVRVNRASRNVILDAWRGLAAMWVVLHHTNQFFVLDLGPFTPVVRRVAELGFLGVDIFFVLSGFLITGVLLSELEDGIRLRRFYVRRFLKIVPQYVVVMLVGIAVSYALPPAMTRAGISSYSPVANPLTYVIFLQNFFPYVPPLGHFWSLAVEEHFYLVYPLLLLGIGRSYGWLSLRGRLLERRVVLAGALIIVIVAVNVIRFASFPEIRTHVAIITSSGQTAQNFFWETQFRIDALVFGCLLRVLEPELRWLFGQPRTGALLRVLVFFLSASVFVAFIVHGGFDYYKWYNWTLIYLASGSLIVVTALSPNSVGRRFLPVAGLCKLGTWSYATYLWQGPLIFVLSRLPVDLRIGAVVFACSCIICGALSTATIERKFLDLRHRVAS